MKRKESNVVCQVSWLAPNSLHLLGLHLAACSWNLAIMAESNRDSKVDNLMENLDTAAHGA